MLLMRFKIMTLCTSLLIFMSPVNGDTIFDEPRLNNFLMDMLDPDATRHYVLASKQLAIHKWLISDCMEDLGFEEESSSESKSWFDALNGKYSYCQDHHIPGIDPPCPAEEVVQASINNSCWQKSYDQIDWSSSVRHSITKGMPGWSTVDSTDPTMISIESDWSNCMSTRRYHYGTRFDFFLSFSREMDLSPEERAAVSDESEVVESADYCFATTRYYERRYEFTDALRNKFFIKKKNNIELAMQRYENAEADADLKIEQLCESDKNLIVLLYEQEKYTEQGICLNDR